MAFSSTPMSSDGPPRPEGLYDTYVYYENNFTMWDGPIGVDWKYAEIIRPGVAILHNGLPERSDYNDPWNLYVVISNALISLIDLLVQGLCFWTVITSKTLSNAIKWFLLADTVMRALNDLMILFMMQCTLNWTCIDDRNYPFSWLLVNQIFSALIMGQPYLVDLWSFGLSTNRIFAIFFNGLHYSKVERLTVPFIGIVFFLVEGLHLSLFGRVRSTLTGTYYYTGYLYMPNLYCVFIFFFPGWFGDLRFSTFNYIGYAIVLLSIGLDLLTLMKIRKMKKLSSNTKSRADFKLAVMVVTTHFFNVIMIVYFQINTMMFDSAEPLDTFLINLPSYFFPIITGATITAFNYPYKEKTKQSRVFNSRPGQAVVSQSKRTEETQVTKLD